MASGELSSPPPRPREPSAATLALLAHAELPAELHLAVAGILRRLDQLEARLDVLDDVDAMRGTI